MHEFVRAMTGWTMDYVVHSAAALMVLGAVAWLGDRLLRRVGPAAQHRLWVAALLAGVTLPLLPAAWLASLQPTEAQAHGITVSITYPMIAAVTGRWTVSPLLATMLCAGYLMTVLFAILRLAWRWTRTAGLVQRSTPCAMAGNATGLLEEAARAAKVAVPRVRCSTATHGPVVLGWLRPLLIVPEQFFETPDEDASAALMHECVHIARRDFTKNLVYEVVAVAVAYHPVCRLIRRRIAQTREMICDEMAAGAGRPEYAASLLRLARAMAVPAARVSHAIGVFDGNTLEERIMRLTTDLPGVSRTQKIAMTTVMACALLGGGLTAAAVPFEWTPQEGAVAAPGHEKIYHVGNGVSAPVLTYSVDAEFTKKAKHAKYQGVDVVACVVDTDGVPRDVHTVRKLGMGLDEKALEAVRQYHFKPALLNGKPVPVSISIEVNFHIY